MQHAAKESSPIVYNAGATKILRYTPQQGAECFVLHWHERVEILHIRKGCLAYTCGSESGVVGEGELLVVPPRTAHSGWALLDSEYDVLMFDLRNFYNETDVCKAYLAAVFEGNAEVDAVVADDEIANAVKRLCDSANPDSLLAVAQIYTLLHLLIEGGFVRLTERPRDSGVREITTYIEENFDKELTTALLCDRFGYTGAHFCRKFKQATGLTPMTYIKLYRLERAYKLIKRGEGQIAEIAARCGFSDANYFTRCFTAHYKQPPTYYKTHGR